MVRTFARGWLVIMLAGSAQVKLDDKWRFVLPAKFRAGAGTQLYLAKADEGQLQLLTQAAFDAEREMHRRAGTEGRDPQRWAKRTFMQSIEPITVDTQARVPVLDRLRPLANLQERGELTLIGMDDRIEVWDSATYAAASAAREEAERGNR